MLFLSLCNLCELELGAQTSMSAMSAKREKPLSARCLRSSSSTRKLHRRFESFPTFLRRSKTKTRGEEKWLTNIWQLI